MNLSGKAVQYWMDKEISLENIFVIDDLNLSFGTIRIRPKERWRPQRIKNINLILNTNQYTRFRFGISDEFKRQTNRLCGDWDDAEKQHFQND
jgi:PTH1 family peptidyl-tRNA hydrolase